MAAQLPSIMGKFSIVFNGKDLSLQADEIQIPKQTPQKQEYKAGGLIAPKKFKVGMEAMETSFKLSGLGELILESYKSCDDSPVRLIFTGISQKIGSCEKTEVKMIMLGSPKDWDPGTIKSGEINTNNVAFDITYYHLLINGESIYERDDNTGDIHIHGVLQK